MESRRPVRSESSLLISDNQKLVNAKAFIRTYPLTRFPDSRFFGHLMFQ